MSLGVMKLTVAAERMFMSVKTLHYGLCLQIGLLSVSILASVILAKEFTFLYGSTVHIREETTRKT
jgi:hypothetical protein